STLGSQTDLTDSVIAAPVVSVVGQELISLQLLDMSPVEFDELLFADLSSAFATVLDTQLITGTGSSGQLTGLFNTAGVNTVAASGNTMSALWSALANAYQQIAVNRGRKPTVIVMNPKVWTWILAQLDQTNRPFALPYTSIPNPADIGGILANVGPLEIAGSLMSLPVVLDQNIPTNSGVG